MRSRLWSTALLPLLVWIPTLWAAPDLLTFSGKQFEYRESDDAGHSYSPAGQEDLAVSQETLTISYLEDIGTPAKLKVLAEALAGAYHTSGRLLRIVGGPEPANPQWYILVSLRTGEQAAEVTMTRARLEHGMVVVVAYLRRFSGPDMEAMVLEWFEQHGYRIEYELFSFEGTLAPTTIDAPKTE